MWQSLMEICFPRYCAVCGRLLVPAEVLLCTACADDLPLTGFWATEDNPVARCFWGRVPLVHASAFLYFRDDSPYRKMFHAMKYGGRDEIGVYMGRLYGRQLCQSMPEWAPFTLVPVPMATGKERRRGYNQAQRIAEGIAQSTFWPTDRKLLRRVSEKSSQPGKDRWSRWMNVKDVFEVIGSYMPEQVMLVDDLITTGATLDACAHAILSVAPATRIGVLGLGYVE